MPDFTTFNPTLCGLISRSLLRIFKEGSNSILRLLAAEQFIKMPDAEVYLVVHLWSYHGC